MSASFLCPALKPPRMVSHSFRVPSGKATPAVVHGFPVIQHGKQIHQAGALRIPAGDGQQPVEQGEYLVHGGLAGRFTLSPPFSGTCPTPSNH